MAGKAKDYDRGTRIADRRKELGLTQDELADRIGIGRQALSAIENGGEFKVQTFRASGLIFGCVRTVYYAWKN